MTRGAGRRIATISHIEALLVVAMVFVAVAMARGFGSARGGCKAGLRRRLGRISGS